MTTRQGSRGRATALLVIDVQRGLFHRSTPVRRGDELVATINALVDRAHAAGVPVVYVQHSSDKVLPFGSDGWKLDQRLHPGLEDLVIHKEHGDAFRETGLADALAGRGVGRVVVTGLVDAPTLTQVAASLRPYQPASSPATNPAGSTAPTSLPSS